MPTEKRTRRKYTEDFKREAVVLVTEQGHKIAEAARSLGISEKQLAIVQHWMKALFASSHMRCTFVK